MLVAGTVVSPWHDVPLYLSGGLLSFMCEIPAETRAKMEVATVRTLLLGSGCACSCRGSTWNGSA